MWQGIIRGGTGKLQVLDVIAIYPIPELTSASNFITIHSEFTSHDILTKPNVMLYCLTADTAYFIQYDEGDNLLDTRKHPLIFLSQTRLSKRLLRLPKTDFIQYAKSVDVERVNAVWMFHSIRRGSTAYSQVFNSLPGWITISELMTVFGITLTHADDNPNYVKTIGFETIAEAVIKCYLKNIPTKNKGVFIKTSANDEHLIPTIKKCFWRH